MARPQSDAARALGARIRDHRRSLGVSQQDLAILADVHFTNLARIERGESNPTLHTIVRIAGALEVDPGELIAGIGPDDVPDPQHQPTALDLVRARKGQHKPQ